MLDDADRTAIAALIEQSRITIVGGIGVLLLVTLPIGSGGPVGLLCAIIGAGVGGWSMTQPWATPLSLTPRAPGFSQEIVQEEEFLERIKMKLTVIRQTHHAKIRLITGREIVLLGLVCLIRFSFFPAWPSTTNLVLWGILLFMSFLFGAMVAIASCWLSIYKTLLRTPT